MKYKYNVKCVAQIGIATILACYGKLENKVSDVDLQ